MGSVYLVSKGVLFHIIITGYFRGELFEKMMCRSYFVICSIFTGAFKNVFLAAFVFYFDFAEIFSGISIFFCTESIRVVLVFFLGGNHTLLGTNISPPKVCLKISFLFPTWDTSIR